MIETSSTLIENALNDWVGEECPRRELLTKEIESALKSDDETRRKAGGYALECIEFSNCETCMPRFRRPDKGSGFNDSCCPNVGVKEAFGWLLQAETELSEIEDLPDYRG